jgi:hypothetical protein
MIVYFFEQMHGVGPVIQEPDGRMAVTDAFVPHMVKLLAPKCCAFITSS